MLHKPPASSPWYDQHSALSDLRVLLHPGAFLNLPDLIYGALIKLDDMQIGGWFYAESLVDGFSSPDLDIITP